MDKTSYAENFLDRFLKDRDFVWIFQNDLPSPFLRSSYDFSDDDFTISIIDNFGGLQPILLHHETLGKGEAQIPFRPTAILDSNVVSSLVQFVTSTPLLSPSRYKTIYNFLRFLIERRLDYNPFFYYMEGFWRENANDFSHYAESVSRAIITLHSMDNARFLESGEIVIDESRLAVYAKEYGKESLEDIAREHTKSMLLPPDPHIEFIFKLSYASLLKMALMHKTSNRSPKGKFRKLKEFMEQTLKIAMGVERLLSLGYFSGLYDGFIPLQRGSNSTRILKRIRAASWDLLLLRMPAQLLATTGEHGIAIGYICTSDKTLSQIAKSHTLQAIISGFGPNPGFTPLSAYDYSYLLPYVDAAVLDRITDEDSEWQKKRLSLLNKAGSPLSEITLSEIVIDLENRVSEVCIN